MTKDEVIALARKAGLWEIFEHYSGEFADGNPEVCLEELERFANLIEDHLTWSDIHTCNPDCTKPACVSLRRAEAHAAAVEREECAKVCEDKFGVERIAQECAAAIRNRSTHDQNDHS